MFQKWLNMCVQLSSEIEFRILSEPRNSKEEGKFPFRLCEGAPIFIAVHPFNV